MREFHWTGRNRREAIRFLGDAWRGFSGLFPPHPEPPSGTVSFRNHEGIQAAMQGQRIVRGADGNLRVFGEPS